jgi:hypothetical protein
MKWRAVLMITVRPELTIATFLAVVKQQIVQSRPMTFNLLSDQIISHPHRGSTLSRSANLGRGLSHKSARNIQAKRRVKVFVSKPLLQAMARIHIDQQSADR